MSKTIQFSVHRNPLKDADGKVTFQVRHENFYTARRKDLMQHLQVHNTMNPEVMELALNVLATEIVDFLTDNKRLHLEGIGTFSLKVGFRKRPDEDGNLQKLQFTNAADITGNDVAIETINFAPDKALLDKLNNNGYHFINKTGRGNVGHSASYTKAQVVNQLNAYLDEHSFITRSQMKSLFGMTQHMALKWLDELVAGPEPMLVCSKVGNSLVYKRK
ncbi:hypothetical protein [Xylanibacter brevis]|uniref:HU family DNA-binding protein n=1 Tax=Xylanibacter brevis TaxID=83231 RepID=UPI000488BFB9|nr:hypothetical protein [Xylanibacter brevis]